MTTSSLWNFVHNYQEVLLSDGNKKEMFGYLKAALNTEGMAQSKVIVIKPL